MHKIFYNKFPPYMKANFVWVSDIHKHNTRSNIVILIKHVMTLFYTMVLKTGIVCQMM